MAQLVQRPLDTGLFDAPAPVRDGWMLGTVDGSPSAGVVSVLLDGDTVAVSMLTAVLCSDTHRVLTARVGASRMVVANLTDPETVFGPAVDEFSHVMATRNSAQTIANTTTTTVIYDDEVYDTLGEYEASTGVFTATYAGKYLVCASLASASALWAVGTYWLIGVYDGTNDYYGQVWQVMAEVTMAGMSHASKVVSLAASGTLSVRCRQSRGGNTNTGTATTHNWVTIDRID